MAAPWLTTAKSAYVGTARAAQHALSAVHLAPQEPHSRQQRWRHWLTSLPLVHDSEALIRLGVPWWTYRAIDVVETWLLARPEPVRAFEFGSGASTVWLAERCASVDSVEHHAAFAASMEEVLRDRPGARLHVVPPLPSPVPRTPSGKEGYDGVDFSDYVSTIDRVGDLFDLIVIDGRARAACLALATEHLAPGGLVVFDNSRRRRYRAAIESSPFHETRLTGLTPTLPYPEQTSLLYRGR